MFDNSTLDRLNNLVKIVMDTLDPIFNFDRPRDLVLMHLCDKLFSAYRKYTPP